jgi:hypothetical protein
MRRSRQDSLTPTAAIPRDALVVGVSDGHPIYLTPRDRSMHLILVGGTGSGIMPPAGLCRAESASAKYSEAARVFDAA